MEPVSISYRIKLNEGQTEVFDFELEDETFNLIGSDADNAPEWTELGFSQCSHCPLDAEEHPRCPVALSMYQVVERFHDTKSIDEVEMEVITEERRVIQTTELQRAIASMFDLLFPVCGCPKTEHMKPLARFHLPLASEEETIFRAASMYLMGQFFVKTISGTGKIEFDGLTEIYNDLHILNVAVARRIQHATTSDSAKNAITLLDMYSTLVPLLIEDDLVEMRGFFQAYLPEGMEETQEEESKSRNNYLEKAKAFSLDLTLMPLDGESSANDKPDWLKQLEEPEEPANFMEEEEPEPEKEPEESQVDILLKNSGLSLSLEPIDGESPPQESSGGKAVFNLPDEDEP